MNETILASRPAVAAPVLPPTPPKMSIRSVDFYYGKFHALKDVSLEIAQNRVTAFIGPSGCGKSTLLRTLNRMYSLYPGQRATGEIHFNGQRHYITADRMQILNLLLSTYEAAIQRNKELAESKEALERLADEVMAGNRFMETVNGPEAVVLSRLRTANRLPLRLEAP